MRKILALILGFIFLAIFSTATASAQGNGKKDDFIPPGQRTDVVTSTPAPLVESVSLPRLRTWGSVPAIGDLYFKSGEKVLISEEIPGDAYLAGDRVEVLNRVKGDALIAGGNVVVGGEIDQDLRVVGGKVRLTGKVGRNVTIVGGDVIVDEKAQIEGNLALVGGKVSVSDQAQVTGRSYVFTPPEGQNPPEMRQVFQALSRVIKTGFLVISVISWLSTLLLGLLLVTFFPKTVQVMLTTTEKQLGKSLLWGLLGSIVVPILALLAMLTVIGLPLGLVLMVSLFMGWYIAKLVAMIFLGSFLMQKLNGQKIKLFEKKPGLYTSFLLGLVIFLVLELVPFLGWLIKLMLVWVGFGSLLIEKWAAYRRCER